MEKMSVSKYLEKMEAFRHEATATVLGNSTADYSLIPVIDKLTEVAGMVSQNADNTVNDLIADIRKVMRETSSLLKQCRTAAQLDYLLTNYATDHTVPFHSFALIKDEADSENIDYAVVTDTGILVLAFRFIPCDVVIEEDGRIFYSEIDKREEASLTDKLDKKCALLKKEIQREMIGKEIVPDIAVEGGILFITPKDKQVTVTNKKKGTKYFFLNGIVHRINNYYGQGSYDSVQTKELAEAVSRVSSNEFQYECKSDMEKALEMLKAFWLDYDAANSLSESYKCTAYIPTVA